MTTQNKPFWVKYENVYANLQYISSVLKLNYYKIFYKIHPPTSTS